MDSNGLIEPSPYFQLKFIFMKQSKRYIFYSTDINIHLRAVFKLVCEQKNVNFMFLYDNFVET